MTKAFDILKSSKWNALEQALIDKYFKGAHKEWNKKTLAPIRDIARTALLKRQSYSCAYCRRDISHEIGHNEIDHVVPKAIPGMARFTYERMNLVATCKRCNKNKGDHNPLAAPLAAAAPYPTQQDDYVWIHPYFHKYSEHIDIQEGLFFAAIGDSKQKARALSVITQCKLKKLAVVERRRAAEKAKNAKDAHLSILRVIGDFPDFTDDEVVRAIKRARPILRKMPTADLVEMVSGIRTGGFSAYQRFAAKLGL